MKIELVDCVHILINLLDIFSDLYGFLVKTKTKFYLGYF